MASTRSASPAGDASPSGSPQLTPRAKLRALLATVDDSSDDDEVPGPIDAKALFKKLEQTTAAAATTTTREPASTPSEDETDEDEEDIIRPRGRIAARLLGIEAQKPARSSISSGQSRERVETGLRRPTSSSNGNDNLYAMVVDEDEDEEVSALPRGRRSRPARSATPEVTTRADSPVSPGLFVSPSPHKSTRPPRSAAGSDSEDELPVDLGKNSRFQALVARKREERLAKEAEEERKRIERTERLAKSIPAVSDADDDDVSDITDDDGGRKLTQEAPHLKPRKASKKALELMNRETQRLNRSLQLAHEAKTKKKITKASLFERFNFKPATSAVEEISSDKVTNSSQPVTPVSAAQTDVEMGEGGTPPSSPPSVLKQLVNPPAANALVQARAEPQSLGEDENGDIPGLEAALTQGTFSEKGKGKATIAELSPQKKAALGKPRRQVRLNLPPVQANLVTLDSDDELEITTTKKGRLDALFDNIPAKRTQESRSMHALRQLAQLASPPQADRRKKNQKPSITAGELQLNLQQRARAQAKLERERRLDALKSKGVVVQTEEEREREREQVEDIVARARQEAEEIMAKEREDAKQARKERKKNGEEDALGFDDSDASFEDSEEEVPQEIELSGSEDEEGELGDISEVGEDAEDTEGETAANPLFDEDAEEDEEGEEAPQVLSDDDDAELVPETSLKPRRNKKHVRIVSDDEEDEDVLVSVEATPRPKSTLPKSPMAPGTDSPRVPTSVLRSATKTFIPGLPVPIAGPAGLGLTQIFAGTMDDNSQEDALDSGSPIEFMPSFDNFPDSQFSATAGESQNVDDMVVDSQGETQKTSRETQTQGVQLRFEQSQRHGFDSLMQMDGTQMSELLPTQDEGFATYSPLKQRFVEPPQSTVETVVLANSAAHEEEVIQDSPLVRKRGKLRRRDEPTNASAETLSLPPTAIPGSPSLKSTVTPAPEGEVADAAVADSLSAFKLMEKIAKRKKRAQEKFDKKKSEANGMVEIQAEESEDEYAGLGGADGEDSSDEDEELTKEMIDDGEGNDINEEKLAAFFADRERAADSAQVDKLFKDITTGMLRKRRRNGGGNNDFDLSDSDDGGEARRRMKRRQFAKMQKALFADERIGKIAENPRNAAFLKSIEDRGSEDEWDFGENIDEDKMELQEESQSQPMQQDGRADESVPDSQPVATAAAAAAANLGRKRSRQDQSETSARPAPNLRRVKDNDGFKASSLADVRRSLSSLLDDPHGSIGSVIPDTQAESDSEGEEQQPSANKESRRSGSVAVVDRISLTRSGSSTLSTGQGGGGRLAFAAPSTSGGFKVPALLRRATTNSLMSNSSSSSTTSSATTAQGGPTGQKGAGGFGDEAKLKRNAGKRSGINYFARENERREKLREGEKRREAKKWKGVEGRSKVVGGLFGGGMFE